MNWIEMEWIELCVQHVALTFVFDVSTIWNSQRLCCPTVFHLASLCVSVRRVIIYCNIHKWLTANVFLCLSLSLFLCLSVCVCLSLCPLPSKTIFIMTIDYYEMTESNYGIIIMPMTEIKRNTKLIFLTFSTHFSSLI